jgi:hypothetical protein
MCCQHKVGLTVAPLSLEAAVDCAHKAALVIDWTHLRTDPMPEVGGGTALRCETEVGPDDGTAKSGFLALADPLLWLVTNYAATAATVGASPGMGNAA